MLHLSDNVHYMLTCIYELFQVQWVQKIQKKNQCAHKRQSSLHLYLCKSNFRYFTRTYHSSNWYPYLAFTSKILEKLKILSNAAHLQDGIVKSESKKSGSKNRQIVNEIIGSKFQIHLTRSNISKRIKGTDIYVFFKENYQVQNVIWCVIWFSRVYRPCKINCL